MSRRVCWGNPKGLSQRSHLFRRLARQRSPLKRLRGKISGHLLRELLGHTVLQRHDQTALRPAGCCRRARLWCLLWEDFKPCAATKISRFVSFPRAAYDHSRSYRSCRKQRQSSRFASICEHGFDVTLTPDESAGRISALLCLYVLPHSTMVTSQPVPR